jgi:hypothetical protein
VLPAHFLRAFFVGLFHVDRFFFVREFIRWIIPLVIFLFSFRWVILLWESFVGSFFGFRSCGICSLDYSFVGCMWASLPFVREFHVEFSCGWIRSRTLLGVVEFLHCRELEGDCVGAVPQSHHVGRYCE